MISWYEGLMLWTLVCEILGEMDGSVEDNTEGKLLWATVGEEDEYAAPGVGSKVVADSLGALDGTDVLPTFVGGLDSLGVGPTVGGEVGSMDGDLVGTKLGSAVRELVGSDVFGIWLELKSVGLFVGDNVAATGFLVGRGEGASVGERVVGDSEGLSLGTSEGNGEVGGLSAGPLEGDTEGFV